MKSIIILSSLSLITSSFLYGVDLPNIGDALRQVQPPKEMEKPKNDIPTINEQEQSRTSSGLENGKKVLVKRFFITGAEHMNNDELKAIVAPYENKELSFKEMEDVANLITKSYRGKGYFVARAFVPKQNLFTQDDRLKIEVVEGSYGQFHLKNSSLVSNERVQGIFDDIKGRDIISNESLERAMLIANDTPGLKVTKASVTKGNEAETSDFDIVAEATDPYGASIITDNYGSKYTGRYKINAGVSANSPLGYGDKFGMNILVSTTTDLKNGKVFYNFPLMDNGLRSEISASRTTYSLAEDYKALDALGNSNALDTSLIYPIIKTKQETFDVSIGYSHKNMKDEVRSIGMVTHKEADVTNLTLSYMRSNTLFGLNSTTNANIVVTRGNVSINDADALSIDQAGAKTNGDYSKVSGSIDKSLEFNSQYSLTTTLRFQKALDHKNLDGSEDFSLGGSSGVRAFPDGEYSAENGYLIGTEFFYNLPKYEGFSHKVSIFADTGYAKMENPISGSEGRQLSDVGLGYQANFKQFFTKAQVAHVIGGQKSETEDKESTRFLLQLGWVY